MFVIKSLKETNELRSHFATFTEELFLIFSNEEVLKEKDIVEYLLKEIGVAIVKNEGFSKGFYEHPNALYVIKEQLIKKFGYKFEFILENLSEPLQGILIQDLLNKNPLQALQKFLNSSILQNYFKNNPNKIVIYLNDSEVIKNKEFIKYLVKLCIIHFSKNEDEFLLYIDKYVDLLPIIWFEIDFENKKALLKHLIKRREGGHPQFNVEHHLVNLFKERYDDIKENERDLLFPFLVANDASLNLPKKFCLVF